MPSRPTGPHHAAAGKEMVIFTRTFDFLTWLLPVTNKFPRAQRHTVTSRLLGAAFDLREELEAANLRRGGARVDRLLRADARCRTAKDSRSDPCQRGRYTRS